jgi:DNA ligase-1
MQKNVYWLVLAFLMNVFQLHATELMLPQVYSGQDDISGWLMSEKLDGVRGYWDGKQLLSKNGNKFFPPPEFTEDLPPFPIEGEIWGGRGTFEKTVSIVKQQQPHPGWFELDFAIFDVPEVPGGFRTRIKKAHDWFTEHPSDYAFVIPQTDVINREELKLQLEHIEKLGGEGLVVRNPDGLYSVGRSTEILKVKNHRDAEAIVLEHLPGKGKYNGKLGAMLVELPNGTRFKIGSGFSDAERASPPPIGTLITFKFFGYYQSGIPKFPSYLRIREDAGI